MVLTRVTLPGLLSVVVAVAACTTVRRVQPVEYLAVNTPDVVWVTRANNTVVPVAEAEVAGDTLRGTWEGKQEPVAIPLGDIQSVQAKTPDHTKTALLATTVGVALVSSVYIIWISKAGESQGGVQCAGVERPADYSECQTELP
jgi:hypothetical protein